MRKLFQKYSKKDPLSFHKAPPTGLLFAQRPLGTASLVGRGILTGLSFLIFNLVSPIFGISSRLKRNSTLILTGLSFLILISCSSSTPPDDNVTFSGTVTLEDTTDFSGVKVSLYKPVELDTALVRINQQYPNIGVQISQETEFDHREYEPVYTATTSADGSWEIKDVEEDEYHVVAEKEGWGWKTKFQNEQNQINSISMVLYPFTILTGFYNDTTLILQENHTYILKGEVIINSNSSIVFENRTKIIAENDAKLIINGNINCPDVGYFQINSTGKESGSWKGIEIQKNNVFFKNAIVRNTSNGIKINDNNIEISFVQIKNTKNIPIIIQQGVKEIFIENCNLVTGINGIDCFYIDSTVNLNKNIIVNQSEYGIKLNNASPIIQNNLINSNYVGIYCLFNSDANILHNQIEYSILDGIQIGGSDPDICYNNLYSNLRGCIRIPPTGYAEGSANPEITHNNFLNSPIVIYLYGSSSSPNAYNINARLNWWGSTSLLNIQEIIYDKNDIAPDDINYNYTGEVIWEPFSIIQISNAGIN